MLDLFKGSLRHFQAGLRVAPAGSLGQAAGWHCPLVATREYSRARAELVAQELKAPCVGGRTVPQRSQLKVSFAQNELQIRAATGGISETPGVNEARRRGSVLYAPASVNRISPNQAADTGRWWHVGRGWEGPRGGFFGGLVNVVHLDLGGGHPNVIIGKNTSRCVLVFWAVKCV